MTELDEIYAQIVADPANNWARELGYRPLFTAGVSAKIAIVGQAPGRRAQESGIPWDDLSGIRLRDWLGVTDAQFYDPSLFAVLPMDFFYPGKGATGDLPPRADFAATWHPRIFRQLPAVQLRILVGSYAQKYYLAGRRKATLTETVRSYREYLPEMMPLVHPSPLNFRWQTQNPWFQTDVVAELKRQVDTALHS